MRWLLVMAPVALSCGTLKSTRMSTRLPARSRSRMDLNLGIKQNHHEDTKGTKRNWWFRLRELRVLRGEGLSIFQSLAAISRVSSTTRLEYPHSLSYQLTSW